MNLINEIQLEKIFRSFSFSAIDMFLMHNKVHTNNVTQYEIGCKPFI